MKITQEQFDELNFLQSLDTKEFNKKLEELLDVEVRPYTSYQYFVGGNYIGDSAEETLNDLLNKMGVEVE